MDNGAVFILMVGCFLSGVFVGVVSVDTYASSYKQAESACVELNSHVRSFDTATATCENTAEIDYRKSK